MSSWVVSLRLQTWCIVCHRWLISILFYLHVSQRSHVTCRHESCHSRYCTVQYLSQMSHFIFFLFFHICHGRVMSHVEMGGITQATAWCSVWVPFSSFPPPIFVTEESFHRSTYVVLLRVSTVKYLFILEGKKILHRAVAWVTQHMSACAMTPVSEESCHMSTWVMSLTLQHGETSGATIVVQNAVFVATDMIHVTQDAARCSIIFFVSEESCSTLT